MRATWLALLFAGGACSVLVDLPSSGDASGDGGTTSIGGDASPMGGGGVTASTGGASSTGGAPGVGGQSMQGGGGSGGICDSGHTTPSEALDACLTANCCAPFLDCLGNDACAGCLDDPDQANCDAIGAFTDFLSCQRESCPEDFCDAFGRSDDQGAPAYACNLCLDQSCCAPLEPCIGEGTEDELLVCAACIDDPAGLTCQDAAEQVQAGAAAFLDCATLSCTDECGS